MIEPGSIIQFGIWHPLGATRQFLIELKNKNMMEIEIMEAGKTIEHILLPTSDIAVSYSVITANREISEKVNSFAL